MTDKMVEMRQPVHCYSYRVLYGDTDSGGVVYYANYLRYFEAGRTEFIRDFGSSYRKFEESGFVLPVIECHARYKAPARYDDLLSIETCLLNVKKVSCRFNYRILKKEDKKLLMQGYTIHAVVNRHGKLTSLPQNFMELLHKMTEPRKVKTIP